MAKISARVFVRSNREVPSRSHAADHFASRPAREGFSGTVVTRHSLGVGTLGPMKIRIIRPRVFISAPTA